MCILEEQRSLKGEDFKRIAQSEARAPPTTTEQTDASLERAFWSSIAANPPIYGADTPYSLFDEKLKYGWNLRKLEGCLLEQYDVPDIPGVTSPMTYFGMWKSFFAWHKEDIDLYSVNYLHFGAPKMWYCVSPKDADKFDAMARTLFPENASLCPGFLRHKDIMISPKVLQAHRVPFIQMRQNPGEFIVLNAAAYHAGWNTGFNAAEAINFGLPEWLEMGKEAVRCDCDALEDGVQLDMGIFFPELREDDDTSSEEEEEESDDEEDEEDEDSFEYDVDEIVGEKIRLYIKQKRTWYVGKITSYIKSTGHHRVELPHFSNPTVKVYLPDARFELPGFVIGRGSEGGGGGDNNNASGNGNNAKKRGRDDDEEDDINGGAKKKEKKKMPSPSSSSLAKTRSLNELSKTAAAASLLKKPLKKIASLLASGTTNSTNPNKTNSDTKSQQQQNAATTTNTNTSVPVKAPRHDVYAKSFAVTTPSRKHDRHHHGHIDDDTDDQHENKKNSASPLKVSLLKGRVHPSWGEVSSYNPVALLLKVKGSSVRKDGRSGRDTTQPKYELVHRLTSRLSSFSSSGRSGAMVRVGVYEKQEKTGLWRASEEVRRVKEEDLVEVEVEWVKRRETTNKLGGWDVKSRNVGY